MPLHKGADGPIVRRGDRGARELQPWGCLALARAACQRWSRSMTRRQLQAPRRAPERRSAVGALLAVGVLAIVCGASGKKVPIANGWRMQEWFTWSEDASDRRSVFRVRDGCVEQGGKVTMKGLPWDQRWRMEVALHGKNLKFVETQPEFPKVAADLVLSHPLGDDYPRESAREFVKDIVPLLLAIQVVENPESVPSYRDYHCFGVDCDGAKEEKLNMLWTLPGPLRQVIESRMNSTIAGPILAALSSRLALVQLKDYISAGGKGVCFDNLILVSERFPDKLKDVFFSDHFLWREMKVDRDPVSPKLRHQNGKCVVHVEAVSRKKMAGYDMGTSFHEIPDLVNVYNLEGRVKETFAGERNIELHFDVDYYESRSALYQMFKANRADVLIVPYGVSEANLFFMRRGTFVFEAFTPGTSVAHYEPVAQVLGINFAGISGKPTPRDFRFCLGDRLSDTELEQTRVWYQNVLTNQTTYGTHLKASVSSNKTARTCIEGEAVFMDVDKMTEVVSQAVKLICA